MNLQDLIKKTKEDIFFQIALLSFSAVIMAYLSEVILNLRPCILCIYQRIPYFALAFLASIALYFPSSKKVISLLITLFIIVEVGLAFYHVGVEHYIFEENYSCQTNHQIGNMLSTNSLMSTCSEVHFRFMNFSMAEWNLIYSMGMLIYFIYKEKQNGFFTWR